VQQKSTEYINVMSSMRKAVNNRMQYESAGDEKIVKDSTLSELATKQQVQKWTDSPQMLYALTLLGTCPMCKEVAHVDESFVCDRCALNVHRVCNGKANAVTCGVCKDEREKNLKRETPNLNASNPSSQVPTVQLPSTKQIKSAMKAQKKAGEVLARCPVGSLQLETSTKTIVQRDGTNSMGRREYVPITKDWPTQQSTNTSS